MIKRFSTRNYKSINDLSIELGKINVFIGENGSGKSNILESLALASAAINGNIENEQLALRGVRISDAIYYRSGFDRTNTEKDIHFNIRSNDDHEIIANLSNDNQPFSKWKSELKVNGINLEAQMKLSINEYIDSMLKQKANPQSDKDEISSESIKTFMNRLLESYTSNFSPIVASFHFTDFIIYAPENYFLRNYSTEETYIEPLGYRGEGLLKLIKIIKKEKPEQYNDIVRNLHLIDWLDRFEIIESNIVSDSEFKLTDKYLEDGIASFDIRSANEGFLFLLFYLTLFISDYTPNVFAIDNIDTALNPKLCTKLIMLLSKLASTYNKQVIITTHNPSILDGLNLNNEDEKLYVITRGIDGSTIATRVKKKEPLSGEAPLKLSEQFLRGYIGGLPKNF